ncbi:MAG: hypothetical protein DYG96_01775 [Chlorobi bacterium CHB2]|nr:hypothetical protein [Chlorobi bacterium CHB2]
MSLISLYSELTSKIARTRRREQNLHLSTALWNTIAGGLAVWSGAIALEMLGEFDSAGRTAIVVASVGLCGLLAAWQLAGPVGRRFGLLRWHDDDTIARRVGHRIPDVGDRLVNTLQLYRALSSGALAGGYSTPLAEAAIAAQGEPLRHHDYDVIIDPQERRRSLLLLLSSTVMMGSLWLAAPDAASNALYRLSHYNREFPKPAPYSLSIQPGNRKVLRGDSIGIVVQAAGIPPRTVTLVLRADGASGADSIELRGDLSGAFRYTIPGVRSATTYSAVAGSVETPEYQIAVTDRPEIRMLQVRVAQPAYTKRGSEQLPDNVGDVSGIRGTSIGVRVETNITPASAAIVQLFPRGGAAGDTGAGIGTHASAQSIINFDTLRIPLAINGTTLTGGFRLARDGEYFITMTSVEGLQNPSPIHYTMSVSTDAAPTIALLQPGAEAVIDETMILPTETQIGDDFGFSWLRLHYRITESRYEEPWKDFRTVEIPIPQGDPAAVAVPWVWQMSRLGLTPGDAMEFYFEVADNDVVAGPKTARTAIVAARFPSLDEMLKETEQAQQQANNDLEKMLKQAQEAKQQMEEVNRELMKQLAQNKRQPNWQETQKLQELMKQHDQMQQRLEQIAENLREVSEKLKEARAISPETLKKYQDLQKLFQDLKNPELMKAMEQMQQAMQKMTPEQMAEAMKNYKFNEEQFRKSIERTMKILERMQTEQKVDELIRRADELARQQETINEQTANTPPNDKATRDQLAERQKELAKDAQKMQQEAEDLSKKMATQQEMPTTEMEQAQQQLQQENPGQQMEQAGEQMEQGNMEQAKQQGAQAKQSAQKFKQKMQGVKQKMQENTQRAVTNKMRKALQDMLDLSKRQEALKERTENTQANSPEFRDQAQEQGQMGQEMQNIGDQLGQLSQKSFAVTPEMGRQLGDAMRQMQSATNSLEQRDGNKASQQQGGAMSAMNQAAMMMQQALAQMQGQGQQSGGMGEGMASFQQRLQQMAAQQQMINQAMQGMGQGQGEGEGEQEGKQGKKKGKNGQGGSEGQDGEENGGEEGRMRKLTQQQQQVKKSLEELNKEARQEGGTRKNRVGDLDRAAQEVEEVLSDMRSGNVTPETLERQEKILSRMLDAMKSQRERDFEKERESKPGVDVTRTSPGQLKFPDEASRAKQQRDLLRSREAGYTKDYETLIRKYFEALGQGAQ